MANWEAMVPVVKGVEDYLRARIGAAAAGVVDEFNEVSQRYLRAQNERLLRPSQQELFQARECI